uniref:Tail-fiber/lysozyme protein n=1 Tax=Acinetobacter phage vB_AbaM-SPB TaxID=3236747 RepID=A0AB39C8T4_9CAUD
MSNQGLKDGVLAEPVNTSELIYRALKTGMCTLSCELKTTLDLEDVLDIIECWQVTQYNETKIKHLVNKGAKKWLKILLSR